MSQPILTIEHFTKAYPGGKKAVDDLSLQVNPGDICGFIGHNGAGKTTTLRAVAGVLEFDEGEIAIDGHSVRSEPVPCKQVTAYLPDNREARIRDYGGRLELTANLGDMISSYSHGMKQKLALISAFVHAPRLLVLDEPFVGLDPQAAFRLKEMMHELCEQGGAIFFSTHVLEVAEKLCNRIAIIRRGRLVACGPTEEIRGDSSLEEVFLEVVEHEK